jgi:hypothetical protein
MNKWEKVEYSGAFQAKLNACAKLLTKVSLTKIVNRGPRDNSGIASVCKKLKYKEIWELHLRNGRYNILLEDYSFFYFAETVKKRKDPKKYNYCYYTSPYRLYSFEEYIGETYGPELAGLEEIYYPEAIQVEYEQYIAESDMRQDPALIRYDYNVDQYIEGRHPASHMHIGLSNEIRIGAKYILTPVSFVYLVLRQCYPDLWIHLIVTSGGRNEIENQIRKRLESVSESYLRKLDKLELILS